MTNETPASGPAGSLEERALELLKLNRRTGYDPYYKTRYSYSIPSPGRYRWQFFWDSCFHAIALARLDPEMAEQELRTLLTSQRSDGFIGHIVYWGRFGAFLHAAYMQGRFGEWRRRHSAMLQPPVLAQAVEVVYRATGSDSFLKFALPRTLKYYEWISRERDLDGDGLFAIISPYESGMDNSPVYDRVLGLKNPGRMALLWANQRLDFYNLIRGNYSYRRLRPRNKFAVVDPLMNAVYADGLRSLARLFDDDGDDDGRERANSMAERTETAINDQLWDEDRGHYIYLAGLEKERLNVLTAGSLMPLINQQTPAGRVAAIVERHLTNEAEFWTTLPVPSVARSEPAYDPSGEKSIWRGPVCMNLNWLLVRGLRAKGRSDIADEIALRSREAVSRDFREFYSPEDGRGMRGSNFGWATAAVDM